MENDDIDFILVKLNENWVNWECKSLKSLARVLNFKENNWGSNWCAILGNPCTQYNLMWESTMICEMMIFE